MNRRYPLASLSERRRHQLRATEANAVVEDHLPGMVNVILEAQDDLRDIHPMDILMEDDHDIISDDNDSMPGSGTQTFSEAEVSESDTSESDISDSDASETDNAEGDVDFLLKLTQWASKGVSVSKINEILSILRGHHCFTYLPADSRTLLKTPRTINIKNIGGGSYCHIGVEKVLISLIKDNPSILEPGAINLQCNFDGLPLCKSSNSQVWPILMSLQDFPSIPPFVVGVYHGNEKPKLCSEYLADYVGEMTRLKTEGVECNGLAIPVNVTCYVCDAPARAYIAQIKSHTGYFGCGKCTVEGEYFNRRVVFDDLNAPRRTDESFLRMEDEDHHVGNSPLLNIPETKMVTQFPYEYMHLVCLGVMRKLLLAWVKGSLTVRMHARKVTSVNERILAIVRHVPFEFARKPRVMQEVMRWKATELRLFLVYTGPYLLEGILSPSAFKHFLALHYAIRVLISEDYSQNLGYAKTLLVYFVKKFEVLYGKESLSYNVHGLLHLVDDCKVHGPLDRFSAFKFENQLSQIKRLVRKPNLPLPQIVRRLHEQSIFSQCVHPISKIRERVGNLRILPFGLEGPQYSNYPLNNAVVADKAPNNCIVMKSGEIVIVDFIATRNGEICVVGKPFENVSLFYDCPAPSENVGIYLASNLLGYQVWDFTDVRGKAILIPSSTLLSQYYVAEILHS